VDLRAGRVGASAPSHAWARRLGHRRRVYAVTTRRDLSALGRPLPGSAPEFWPEDWSTYDGHDGYGWGATTANLLLRHLFGVQETRDTRQWTARLAPALPTSLLVPGRHYAIRRLTYRGLTFDLAYTVSAEASGRCPPHPRCPAPLRIDGFRPATSRAPFTTSPSTTLDP
jgi:hypothetical protein